LLKFIIPWFPPAVKTKIDTAGSLYETRDSQKMHNFKKKSQRFATWMQKMDTSAKKLNNYRITFIPKNSWRFERKL